MSKISLALAIAIIFFNDDATAQPVLFPKTGNAYDLIPESVDWPTAKQHAENMIYRGVRGRLATINSQDENDFLLSTFSTPEAWIGGFHEEGSAEPDRGFRWITESRLTTRIGDSSTQGSTQATH